MNLLRRLQSALPRPAAQPRDGGLFDLVGYFECKFRVGRFSRTLRIGKRLPKPLPDRLKQAAAKARLILELGADHAEKLDEQCLQHGRADKGVVDQIVAGDGHDISPQSMYEAWRASAGLSGARPAPGAGDNPPGCRAAC